MLSMRLSEVKIKTGILHPLLPEERGIMAKKRSPRKEAASENNTQPPSIRIGFRPFSTSWPMAS